MFGKLLKSEAPLGLIAGQGEFPILLAKAVSAAQKKLIAFSVEGYTDKRLRDFVTETYTVKLGGLGELVERLKVSKVKKVMLAGGVPKVEMVNPSFSLDATARGFVNAVKNRGDDHLLRKLALFLKWKCGVSVLDSRLFLKHLLASKGVMTERKPTAAEREDLSFGWRVAKAMGKMDIGQTVVVKQGVVLAIEAAEGTDQAIRRGGLLGFGGAVVVKVVKPNQDLRFDLPCVGLETLESLKTSASRVLGLEAGKTLMLNKEKLIERANQEGLSLVGL